MSRFAFANLLVFAFVASLSSALVHTEIWSWWLIVLAAGVISSCSLCAVIFQGKTRAFALTTVVVSTVYLTLHLVWFGEKTPFGWVGEETPLRWVDDAVAWLLASRLGLLGAGVLGHIVRYYHVLCTNAGRRIFQFRLATLLIAQVLLIGLVLLWVRRDPWVLVKSGYLPPEQESSFVLIDKQAAQRLQGVLFGNRRGAWLTSKEPTASWTEDRRYIYFSWHRNGGYVFALRHPDAWWGHFMRPELWLTIVSGAAMLVIHLRWRRGLLRAARSDARYGPSSPLKNGDWLRAQSVFPDVLRGREVPVPFFQQAASASSKLDFRVVGAMGKLVCPCRLRARASGACPCHPKS